MNLYQHKLCSLLQQSGLLTPSAPNLSAIACLSNFQPDWTLTEIAEKIAKASDRVNFETLPTTINPTDPVPVRHLISAQPRTVQNLQPLNNAIITRLNEVAGDDPTKAFWWFWRFSPEYLAEQQSDALLFPASHLIPDCPRHSYNSTVSAIAGALLKSEKETETHPDKHPYLLLFTFSPVQEFIKSSRKFLDFWAGSYLLHYLSVRLCWFIARVYGPDAVITPSLWSQEIIDALILKKYPDFLQDFTHFQKGSVPVSRFINGTSTSLSTAGFPNTIVAIVPGKSAAEKLGKKLCQHLNKQWKRIAFRVRSQICQSVMNYLQDSKNESGIKELLEDLARSEGKVDSPENPNRRDIERWKKQASNWQWNKLWKAQIEHTWEPYWTAVPLGSPDQKLSITGSRNVRFAERDWIQAQEAVAPSRQDQSTPTEAEDLAYQELNIGTWWGNAQSRLGQAIQAVKNTRNWNIPAAPGERSTLSGQFSAVHPQLLYGTYQELGGSIVRDFREGAGINSGSMQLFWRLMALVYPGLFNGSEKLNALELTKRMAWSYGGVAKSLGISLKREEDFRNKPIEIQLEDQEDRQTGYQTISVSDRDLYYDNLIRFPNISSIAAARFIYENLPLVRKYWHELYQLIKATLPGYTDPFGAKTRGRALNILKVDRALNLNQEKWNYYNGVMFSSKWLSEDMGVEKEQLVTLRSLVEEAHKKCHIGDGSPSDWWAIIVADGDGMGKYVSGAKLKPYEKYIERELISNEPEGFEKLLETRKRMGPATHVGLNRALLDFSNRLVPYLTEQRFCGKVVYSGGDDVLAVLPLADLPEYLLCLRSAWCGGEDPYPTDPNIQFISQGGYWQPQAKNNNFCGLPNWPLFTMGEGATMSAGIVIAHKSVPLPTVLESLWSAEEDRAKEMQGATINKYKIIPSKDGFCFRVIYGGGNVLEASMKGHLLPDWWNFVADKNLERLAPVLYRLAEELPTHAALTESAHLVSKAAKVIITSRDEMIPSPAQEALYKWLDDWEDWAYAVYKKWQEQRQKEPDKPQPVGCDVQDLAKLLRLTAFWLDKMAQQKSWG